MKFKILFLVFFINFYSFSFSQTQPLSTKSGKAKNAYNKAMTLLDMRQNEACIQELDKAIIADPNFIEAYIVKGDAATELGKYDVAEKAYQMAIDIKDDFFIANYFSIAYVQYYQGKYESAKINFTKYLAASNEQYKTRKKAEDLIAVCNFAIEAMKHPVPFNPENLGDSINTAEDEYLPTLTADEQTLIITRRQPADRNTADPNAKLEEDFYISVRKNGQWSKAKNMGTPINTHGNEGAQCISADGQWLFFTACNREDGSGSCDLYFSYKAGNRWSVPVNMGSAVNSNKWDSQPSISSDGKTLYFASGRSGGNGNMDIWYTTLNNDNTWGVPVNIGKTINTDGNEMSPFIHPDNQTLYFTSDRHPGMGGSDIFYTRRLADGSWGKPVNIGYPINTVGDESSLIVSAKGDMAYFASTKLKGKGKFDLYGFELYEEARPTTVTYMKGKVYDKETNKRLAAKFDLIDLDTKVTVMQSTSNEGNGEFLVCLPANKNYALNVSKNGYLFFSENFSLKDNNNKTAPFLMDVPLLPIKVGEKVVLKNIFFETGSFDLKKESMVELDKLKSFLTVNKAMKVEISGHTDNVGDDKFNQKLSENRAKSVFNYLIANGIAAERLSYKGYGEIQPIDDNKMEKGKANNRRTEFKIVSN